MAQNLSRLAHIFYMEQTSKLLDGYTDLEKGAYLAAIASIATADHIASQEEVQHLTELCEAAGLSESQTDIVVRSATELPASELNKCLDILKRSYLRFSLVTDIIAFAKADGHYSPEEQEKVKHMSSYLGLNQQQFAVLDEFATKAAGTDVPDAQKAEPGFLDSLGLGDKMRSAGINPGGLLKGLLGIAGPLILSGMVGRALGGRRGGMMGGGFGPSMGGMLGGGMLGGGLGSLIGMLSGGRGYRRSGGLLGRILGF
ncbi:MAG: TerB family tellurite resistance protein [Sphingobacteriales bacterium]|nr:MAG: TerB family tellurite resistance protein [Sphingobacteriales bacterium]